MVLNLTPETNDLEDHWVSLSDLMSGLMMVFMLIALIFMLNVEKQASKGKDQARKITEITKIHKQLEEDLYDDLKKEFGDDLLNWGAEINRDLSIRFNEPEILFDVGKKDLKDLFKTILQDFFPRYIKILTADKYRENIAEIRIEGHTSSTWNHITDEQTAYFNNMELSQSRTRSTLEYLFTLESIKINHLWLKEHITANGLSSSKLIYNNEGVEDPMRSQRVEFKVKTNMEEEISKVLSETE
jgi:outer membrane protein OmpA-like peptidoglycan-associated protein